MGSSAINLTLSSSCVWRPRHCGCQCSGRSSRGCGGLQQQQQQQEKEEEKEDKEEEGWLQTGALE